MLTAILTVKGFSARWLTEYWQTAMMGPNKNQIIGFEKG
jgi:hypothetical protein